MACRKVSHVPVTSLFEISFGPQYATVDPPVGSAESKTFQNLSGSQKPRVIVRPKTIHFGVGEGAVRPTFRRIWITSKATGLKFNATQRTTKGGNWLTLAPASGTITTASFLAASVNSGIATSLEPGVYNATIEVTTPGATQETHEVNVALKVFAPGEKG